MQLRAAKKSAVVGLLPALISLTRADPSFATKHASISGVMDVGSLEGSTPKVSRVFSCDGERSGFLSTVLELLDSCVVVAESFAPKIELIFTGLKKKR